MKGTSTYILDKPSMRRLLSAMREVSLDLEVTGEPKVGIEGVEQIWKCSDNSGEFFSFVTCEVSEKNGFQLKAGTICLVLGPPARADVASAFKRFESVLMALGAELVKPTRGSG